MTQLLNNNHTNHSTLMIPWLTGQQLISSQISEVKVVKNVLLELQATRWEGNIQQHLKYQNQCTAVTTPPQWQFNMQNKQLHPSTDIVTKWNVQSKKRKKNSNNKGNPTKKHFVGPSRGFQCHKKISGFCTAHKHHILNMCQNMIYLFEQMFNNR